MEHSKPSGVVHCDYSGNPLYAEIRIWDDGTGFDTEDLPHLFERFYRVDKSHSRQTGGTGLGLSIVKHGAALHHAQIRTESQPGQGTKITIGFPLDPI